jgi:Uma2 family endonuclease
MTPTAAPPEPDTVADLLHDLGDVPPDRVLWTPRPGTATEKDLLRCLEREPKRLVELIDGTLVEKPMGKREAMLAMWLGTLLNNHVVPRRLGYVAGADGPIRVAARRVRVPDVWFVARASLPDGVDDEAAIADYPPDLAAEVVSRKSTKRELERKRREYFAKGTKLVWVVDRKTMTVAVYTDPGTAVTLGVGDTLTGGEVLPGFAVPVADLFSYLD